MYRILLSIIFLFSLLSASSQKTEALDNLSKYWNYKDRLHNYFVKVGPGIGESVVAHIRNKNQQSEKGFEFSDQTIDLAWYIGILATEYSLLNNEGQDCSATLQELYYAMMALDRLDRCESGEPWDLENDTLDGFFHRYDVVIEGNPERFSIEGRNKNLSSSDTWGSRKPGMPTYISSYDNGNGKPNYYSAAMSQDQLVHLLMSYTLVYKCLPESGLDFIDIDNHNTVFNFHQESIETVDRLVGYLLKDANWIIKDPEGNNVKRGHNALMFAYPLSIIGQRITGKSYDDKWSRSFLAKKLWGLNRVPNWVNDYNSTMSLCLAAMSDSWWDITPFGRVNNTSFYIDKCGKPWNRETFFHLLYQFINEKEAKYYDPAKVLKQIDSAPFDGPYYWSQDSVMFDCCGMQAGKPIGGWCFPNKFRGTKKEQEGLDDNPYRGNYSGIDYMLLYNLYHLLENPIPYRKMD